MRRREGAQPAGPLAILRMFLDQKARHGLVDRCRDGGRCSLGLDREAICVSCDNSYLLDDHQGKRPDFFVATTRSSDGVFCWLFTEMKSGGMDLRDLYDQLQGGAACVERSDLPVPERLDFIPLVLRGRGGVRVSERESFNRYKVSYRGVKRTILIESCGSRLSEVLRRSEGLR
jgi:hypothetical protein